MVLLITKNSKKGGITVKFYTFLTIYGNESVIQMLVNHNSTYIIHIDVHYRINVHCRGEFLDIWKILGRGL